MTGGDLECELEALHQASFGWALGCCRWNREEAADVLQAVYLKVLEGKARFDGRSSLRTWLFATIRRTAAEDRRRRWVRALALGRWGARQPAPPQAADAEALMAKTESTRTLRAALESLPRRQRDLLHLVFYEDLTIAEASQVLGISEGSARTHYARGKERLRRRLGALARP
jgi:RNA polymerase sigma-70 factor (ECF subfamily)